MSVKMRQAVMTSPGSIEINQVPVPDIKDDEVLVKVMRIGVCGSDIHVFHGKHPYTSYPVVQGHETAGLIEKIGSQVKGFKTGDRVTIEPQVSCGECYPCTHGLYNICDSLKVLGFQTTGTASDYFPVPAKKLVKLPDSMDFPYGAMIEPLSVAVRAVKKAGNVEGKKVLVLGAGPIGNLVAQVSRAQGASAVMVCDVNDLRLEIALRCGIDFAVNSGSEDLNQAVISAFGEYEKSDFIFECAGVPETMDTAIRIARKGSTLIIVGVFGDRVPMDMAQVNENELTLIGTARYVIEDFKTAISLVGNEKVHLSPLLTDEYEFAQYADAYRRIDQHKNSVMKVMIKVND